MASLAGHSKACRHCYCKLFILIQFAITLVLIILIEVITGIIGFVFRDTLRETSGDEYQTRLNDTIRRYRRNQDAPDYDENRNDALDTLQNTVSPHSLSFSLLP